MGGRENVKHARHAPIANVDWSDEDAAMGALPRRFALFLRDTALTYSAVEVRQIIASHGEEIAMQALRNCEATATLEAYGRDHPRLSS